MAISTHRHPAAPQWPVLFRSIAHSLTRSGDARAALGKTMVTSTADSAVMSQLAHLRAEAIAAAAPLGFGSWRAVVVNYGEGSARAMGRERASLEALGELVSVGEYDQLLVTGLLMANRDRSTLLSLSSLTAKFWSHTASGLTVITSAITPSGAQRWQQHTGAHMSTPANDRGDRGDRLIWRESMQSIGAGHEAHRAQIVAIAQKGDAFIAPLSFDDYAQMAQLERKHADSGHR